MENGEEKDLPGLRGIIRVVDRYRRHPDLGSEDISASVGKDPAQSRCPSIPVTEKASMLWIRG